MNETETAATLAQRTGSGLVVEVVAKQPSRWRIGRLFTPEPVRIAIEDLTAGQQVALIGDPMLVCIVVDPD